MAVICLYGLAIRLLLLGLLLPSVIHRCSDRICCNDEEQLH